MNKKAPGPGYKWLVLVSLALIHFMGNFAQYQLSPAASEIMETLHITATQYSSVFSAPMTPAIIFSLVTGIIVDKMGLKKPITLSLILAVLGLVLRLFATSYAMLYFALFLLGFATMMATVNGAKILATCFPKERAGVMLGAALAFASAGQAVALATGSLFPSLKANYLFSLVLGVIALCVWFFGVRDERNLPASVLQNATSDIKSPPILECLKVVLKNKHIWVLGLALMVNISANIALGSNMPTALAERGVSAVAAGLVTSVFTVGGIVGCFVVPALIERLPGKRRIVLLIFAVIYGIGVWTAWRLPMGAPILIVMFLAGVGMGGMMPTFCSIPLQIPEIGPVYAGTAGGITTMIQLMGPVLVVPYIVTNLSHGSTSAYYNIDALLIVALIVLICFLPRSVPKADTLKRRK